MRKLSMLTLGFGAACLISVFALWDRSLVIPALTALLLCLAGVFLGKKNPLATVAGLIFLGMTLGFFWNMGFRGLYLNPAAALDGTTCQASLRASDYSYETAYGSAVDAVMELEGRDYQVRVYLDENIPIAPGAQLEGTFRFQITADPEEESTYYPGKGIFLLAFQEDVLKFESASPKTLREKASVLRRQIQLLLERVFPADTVPFAQALLLGNTSRLDYQTDTDLKVSGIRHVVAVSGLHVSILFALVTALTMRKRFLTAILGLPTVLLFAAVAGFSPSVNRACLMCALMLLGLLADREYDGITALSFAVLVMLLVNPMVIQSVSFQMSVASVTGIYLFESGIEKMLLGKVRLPKGKSMRGTLLRGIYASVSVSLSAMALTTPLCAHYFGMVSLVGVITNLLCLWIITLIFQGLVAVCLLSLLWEGGAVFLAEILSFLIRFVLQAASLLADLPVSAVYTESPYIVIWLVYAYVLLVLFVLSRNRKPMIPCCCVLLGLCVALTASWMEPMLPGTRITLLDVGQGQCILLQNQGKTFLVDCGGDNDEAAADLAAATLLSQGIHHLDGVILTHMDKDHCGGAEYLLSRVETDLLILPPVPVTLGSGADSRRIYAAQDITLEWGNADLTVFAPDFVGNENENSLCILFDTEKCDILITGDRSGFAERMLLRYHDIPDVDVLVAGHHGSKNATCEELLAAVKPEIVCISVGEGNPYGHPAPELLQRLERYGCTVLRTDQNGTILIRR